MKDDKQLKIEVIETFISEYQDKITSIETEIEDLKKEIIKEDVRREMFFGCKVNVVAKYTHDEYEKFLDETRKKILELNKTKESYRNNINVLNKIKSY